MPLHLTLASESDIPALVRAQFSAFHPHELKHCLLFPSPDPPTEEALENVVQRTLTSWRNKAGDLTWLKVTDDETGEIVAGAKWNFWQKDSGEGDGTKKRWPNKVDVNWVPEVPSSDVVEFAGKGVHEKEYIEYVMEQCYALRRERLQGPLGLLDICFTAPSHHRRGAGKLLVGWGTEKADSLGLKLFVEASSPGRKLYEKHGFEMKEYIVIDGGNVREEWKHYGKVDYFWMEREAQPVKG